MAKNSRGDWHDEDLGAYVAGTRRTVKPEKPAPAWYDIPPPPPIPAPQFADQGGLSHAERKQRPLCTGVLFYFPDALLEVAYCSFIGNEQHNPGEPLHWAKDKSIGKGDEILRHLIDHGTIDSDGVRHSAKLAWRSLELLQREIEAERA